MELITGKTGIPHVVAADDAELYKLFLGDGAYVLHTGNKLNAELQTGKVIVYDGSLIMQGRLAKIRQTTGLQELQLESGIVGQKRVDLIVAEYRKEQETPIDAWIVGDAPLAIDWLSLTEGGAAFQPVKGQLYKLKNTEAPYIEGTYYRWMGNSYMQSVLQELEHCDLKVVQGSYSTTTYIQPTITTGNIDNGETHQVKLWEIRLDGLGYDANTPKVDHRLFLTDTPYNTLIATALQTKAQVNSMMADLLSQIEDFAEGMSSQILTGKVLYTKAEKLSTIQTGKKLVFDLSGISYVEQAGDTIELYINGLKTNHTADGYTVSVANNKVTFTFSNTLTYTANDYGEIVVRR